MRVIYTILVLSVLLFAVSSVHAGNTIYGINGSEIVRINPADSTSTTIYSSSLGTPEALAQCPNGLLYFLTWDSFSSDSTLYYFNPATPNVPPVAAMNVTGAEVNFNKMSCNASGILYAMDTYPFILYTIDPGTGIKTADISLTASGTSPHGSTNGDLVFDTFGTLYLVGRATDLTRRIWIINTGANTIDNAGVITSLPGSSNNITGVAFDPTDPLENTLLLSLSGTTQLYRVSDTGGGATPVTPGPMPAVLDLSSATVPDPDLSVTKTDGVTSISPSNMVSYTIVVTNGSSYSVTATLDDTVPSDITDVTWTCTAGPCSSGTGNVISTTATLASSESATYKVDGTLNPAAPLGTSLVNTATVSLPWPFLSDATPANNSATDTDSIVPINPTATKSFLPNPTKTGTPSELKITITNPNPGFPLTDLSFTDLFPAGMTVANPVTTTNACGGSLDADDTVLDMDTILEPGDGSIKLTGGTIPASSSCMVTVNVIATVADGYANTIPIGGITTGEGASNDVPVSATLTVDTGIVSIAVVKSSAVVSDPISLSNPKRIPGSFVDMTSMVTNAGTGGTDNNTVLITEPIPPNTALFVGDLGGSGSGPVVFTDGSPGSGLTYTFTALASTTDDVSFSTDEVGSDFTYIPTPDGNGTDLAVKRIQINPKWIFIGDPDGPPNPSFTIRFRVRIQ